MAKIIYIPAIFKQKFYAYLRGNINCPFSSEICGCKYCYRFFNTEEEFSSYCPCLFPWEEETGKREQEKVVTREIRKWAKLIEPNIKFVGKEEL